MKLLITAVLLAFTASAAQAATQAEAEAALADAKKIEAEAAKSNNRWVPTEAALAAAAKALAAGNWDEAATQAGRARALAARSVEQSKEQQNAWRDAVIR